MEQRNKRYGQIIRDVNNDPLGRMSESEYKNLCEKHNVVKWCGNVIERNNNRRLTEEEYNEMQRGEDFIKNVLKYGRGNNGRVFNEPQTIRHNEDQTNADEA